MSDRAPVLPAPPSPIAEACRRFGDNYPSVVSLWPLRTAGVLVALGQGAYVRWILAQANYGSPFVAWPFVVASVFSFLTVALTVVCNWQRSIPTHRPVRHGDEPEVAIIVPTCGEPVPMVLRTLRSVLDQDWPADRLTIIVSDDGHDENLMRALNDYPVIYHSPPPRFAPGRDGAAKAGNLNSALARLDADHPSIEFVETRDADDEVGSHHFLRETIGQLVADARLAYVQTIKEAQVSAGDPFNNRDPIYFRSNLLAKNAANAVFPCGSGLVWRRSALKDIGNFPTWNLVEDLQSGVEALRRGWRGLYLPIVGAVGQVAPEDVPNVYKQRGTWAVDTVRLMFWGDQRGMTLRQRAHFGSMFFSYVISLASLVYLASVVASFLGSSPVNDRSLWGVLYVSAFVVADELFLQASNAPFHDRRKRQRGKLMTSLRLRMFWTGLTPVYAKATLLAVTGGRNNKPVYKVTRKHHDIRWHWRSTIPHFASIALVVGAALYGFEQRTMRNTGQIVVTTYFGTMYVILLGGFAQRGRHGLARHHPVILAKMLHCPKVVLLAAIGRSAVPRDRVIRFATRIATRIATVRNPEYFVRLPPTTDSNVIYRVE